jgi:hypothetical protein
MKSKQLLRETRRPLPVKPGTACKEDYEYERAGTCNIFVAVEPRGQRRIAQLTARRTKVDFVGFVCRMLRNGYSRARKVHLVLDNLNTHLRESFEEVLGMKTAATLLRRIQFHYTPYHASWLNMAGSRSVSCSVNAWHAVLPSKPLSLRRLRPGSGGGTPLDVASSGGLRAETRIGS